MVGHFSVFYCMFGRVMQICSNNWIFFFISPTYMRLLTQSALRYLSQSFRQSAGTDCETESRQWALQSGKDAHTLWLPPTHSRHRHSWPWAWPLHTHTYKHTLTHTKDFVCLPLPCGSQETAGTTSLHLQPNTHERFSDSSLFCLNCC